MERGDAVLAEDSARHEDVVLLPSLVLAGRRHLRPRP